jgi:hypothetical protein
MRATIDAVGRIVVPKPLREALGLAASPPPTAEEINDAFWQTCHGGQRRAAARLLAAGTTVDISRYGAGLQLTPTGRTARLVEEDGVLVATGETPLDDDQLFGLIDASRR